MSRSILFFSGILLLSATYGQNNSIQSISWVIGKWHIEAIEEASDGSSFQEKGYCECSWVLKNTVIRCDRYMKRVEASGRYQKDITRESIMYYQFNPETNTIEVMKVGTLGSRTSVYEMEKDGELLKATIIMIHPSLKISMTIDSTIEKLDANRFQEKELIEFADSSGSEVYASIAIRVGI